MDTIIVRRDGAPDLRFAGREIARAGSSWERASPDFSGSTGRRATLVLYRTGTGRHVCELIEESQWQGEHTRHSGRVCDTVEEIFNFFGAGRFAKELYGAAGLDHVEEVE